MNDICLVCDELAIRGSSGVCCVTEKGMNTLLSASLSRRDGKDFNFRSRKTGVVHLSCRKRYTKVVVGKPRPYTSCSNLRSAKSQFDFQTKCFLCTETIDDVFHKQQKKLNMEKRRKVFHVRTLGFDQTILTHADVRNDEWGRTVLGRISSIFDLCAVGAVYHEDCYRKFVLVKPPTGQKEGRPEEEYVSKAMYEIFHYLDEHGEDQHSMDELMDQISGRKPEIKWVKFKLKEKYGERIIFSKLRTHQTVVCFRDVGETILNTTWYASRYDNDEEESLRVVETAAAIIRKQIQSQAYETKSYPPNDDFLNGAKDMVPPLLLAFMNALIPKKGRNEEEITRKSLSIAHAMITIIRPRSFISPLLLSIAYYIHRKFGSKNLINVLASLGFSASYYHAEQLEMSSLYQPQKSIPPNTFCQYVFDNADVNVATLDGLNTFHSLGGIKCVTPAENLPKSNEIKRITSAPPAEEVGKLGVLELQPYDRMPKMGLKHVLVQDINVLNPIPHDEWVPSLLDTLWMCRKWLSDEDTPKIPEWKGFMQLECEQVNSKKTAVIPLPFINSPPSDEDTLYTALHYAAEDATRLGLMTCFVTMDQPLYLKSREIVASLSNDPLFGKIEMILGGFHMLMSFLGCIGHTMAGSGLKDLLSCVFAPHSVDKMLNGKAYSRAVRGHILVQTSLAHIMLESFDFSPEEQQDIHSLMQTEDWSADIVHSNTTIACIQEKLKNQLSCLKDNGPTSALWVQYFNMVTLMKNFITAQRRGDWKGHLSCAQQMIPYFHASGHYHYAKCTHLYVQDMLTLPNRRPQEKQYMDSGYFSINRSNNQWAGVWSDMAIEQTLMRDMKSEGGLTRGRGLSESVLAKWIQGAPSATSICSSLEVFAKCHSVSGEQHVDFRQSRINRDTKDRRKIYDWLAEHDPFSERDCLMSLSTGVVGSSNINCHQATQLGLKTMMSFTGTNFADMKQSKKNTVLPLSAMSTTIKVNNESVVVIEPLTIFQRSLISKKSDEDVANLLKYELAPYPMTLFDEGCMRKNKKSALYDAFPLCSSSVNLKTSCTVVDGGFLLHRVKWNIGDSFYSICEQYGNYIINHYGNNTAVVFDGYEDINSTKSAEQKRRGLHNSSVEVNVSSNVRATIKQENFLANKKNKTRLIELLVRTLTARGIEASTATGDADRSIVMCGLTKATSHSSVVVVGEDVDLLVLLAALTPLDKNVYFLKPGRGNCETKLFSSKQLQELPFIKCILFLHGFSGCDTTSAIAGKGKLSILKAFQTQTEKLETIAQAFYDPFSSLATITKAGEDMFLVLYRAPPQKWDLEQHRYTLFIKYSAKARSNLSTLPPTKGAAQQHSLRVYLQTQQWLGNVSLNPQQWGWVQDESGVLNPIKTVDPPAPASILESIFCRCSTGCGSRCGCRKAGIHCSQVCTCEGACLNHATIALHCEDADEEDSEK